MADVTRNGVPNCMLTIRIITLETCKEVDGYQYKFLNISMYNIHYINEQELPTKPVIKKHKKSNSFKI